MYNDKGNTKYLKLLKQNYSSSQDVIREIVNLSAIINLPKGTEFFLSDIHGEYEAFLHIMNNCSGVIKEKVDLIFKDTISDYDRQELCTLIYYPREKMALLDEQGKIDSDWYAMTLNQLILVAKLLSSKYTRSKVRKALPEEYAYIIDELLHAQEDEDANQVRYHKQILKTIIDLEDADEFIIALSALIKRLAVDHLHIVGDVFDRGGSADKILDLLYDYHSLDIEWGNHDIWKILTVILAVSVAVLIAVLVKIRAQLRDINEQLDFLCEKDTNMLLLTDTNMADIGRLKERINRFLEQWHRQREAAAKKEQMISDTYTNLSHDIRTPLTSLDGYFQLLRDETDKSAQEHYIDIIQERITSLKDMLEELFMFTKIKNDSFKLELSNCCVSRLLKQTVFSYYEEWKKQGIEPSLDICEDTIFITANVQALRRVFQNVIKNALVHGQKSICIQMKQQDSCNCRASDDERTSKNRIVHILVSNDVKNPDDIDVDKVFERFYKADEARSISSSGLGLSIAKELVERMGGSIEARLEGKRFVVEILFECE